MAPPTAAVEVRGLTFRYPGAAHDTLRGVDLRIEAGDFVAVVGGNGSGKTTLCKAFNGLVPHFWSGDLTGTVLVDGRDTADLSVAELSHHVGYVYQDFGNQLVRPTVRDDVAFAPVNFGLADWRERTDEALEALGITAIADRFTWQLSGGQQHLTALAGALALRPSVLVVDEPVAEVDPARAAEIYERLAWLNRTLGTTVVVIEHHAELVARYARSVVLMADGAPAWHLPVAEALARTDDLAAADIPAPQVTAVARAFAPTGPVPLTVPQTVRWLEEREVGPRVAGRPGGEAPEVEVGAGARPGGEVASVPDEPRVVAHLEGVGHGYRAVSGPRTEVLTGIDLTLREGERVALVGSNGAGKSTLLTLLAGLAVPRAGVVRVDGTDTRDVSAAELADTVCYLCQRPEEMFLQDSVRADVAMHPAGRRVAGTTELVEEVLERMQLGDVAHRDGRLLSGGQQRRATLAVGLAMRPRLLLLDEPTSSLDLRSRDDVIAMLTALAEHIRCTVVATHDMHLVAEWADRVIVLDGGRVLADATPAELFARPDLLERARLVPPQVTQLGLALGLDPVPLCVPDLLRRLTPRTPTTAGAPA
ncbi:energy-coupling factor transport system ATP-binding protein [Sediminihabitans luteus]|uniref:Energy-coupling factor transport system ATP-binding protein n=1 Tax=Sediminihabitans luteus TaxID=1138585 RepID=A0A2M9CCZ6_9CELL|nr:ABC transporter ATP-binding protein [Sediminihabitans luteus]PJJ69181.1 energy-coupling factor transport system ATP-binding protein [Sediminihabitans luteus]GII98856.1 energy-coupling factor ABC transporter ATP-binding protein [Sediminihabitans luteus]